jgi:hypothetical protein
VLDRIPGGRERAGDVGRAVTQRIFIGVSPVARDNAERTSAG